MRTGNGEDESTLDITYAGYNTSRPHGLTNTIPSIPFSPTLDTPISTRRSPSSSHTLTFGKVHQPTSPTAIISILNIFVSPGKISGIDSDLFPCQTNDSAVSTWTDNAVESVGCEFVTFKTSGKELWSCTDAGGCKMALLKLAGGGSSNGGNLMTVLIRSVASSLRSSQRQCPAYTYLRQRNSISAGELACTSVVGGACRGVMRNLLMTMKDVEVFQATLSERVTFEAMSTHSEGILPQAWSKSKT